MMKTAIIIRTGEFFCKHLHDIGAIYNCCMFKSQVGRVKFNNNAALVGGGAGAYFGD